MTLGLQRGDRVVAQRDLSRLDQLRRAERPFNALWLTVTLPATRSTSCQRSAINSPMRMPGRKRHENHRAPLLIDRGKQAVHSLEVEEVELIPRHLEPVDLRDLRDRRDRPDAADLVAQSGANRASRPLP
jgi:hypothetical protein